MRSAAHREVTQFSGRAAGFVVALVLLGRAASAEPSLACGQFTQDVIPAPEPRGAASAVHRFEHINETIKTEPHRVLFFGDSLTERFDKEVWREHMAPRGVLNAGISGDRSENLLWRLQHGHLAGPLPAGVVVLIGTNDLGFERPPEQAAEGIRANLLYLREQMPRTPIVLLGLWPRGASPEGRLRRATVAVNQLIRHCGDGHGVTYADLGSLLLDEDGRLEPAISTDLLHFTNLGYARLAPRLDALIDAMLARR